MRVYSLVTTEWWIKLVVLKSVLALLGVKQPSLLHWRSHRDSEVEETVVTRSSVSLTMAEGGGNFELDEKTIEESGNLFPDGRTYSLNSKRSSRP